VSDQAKQGLFSPLLQRARIRAALPYISGDVLDIGCGNGALAAFVPPERYCGYDRAADAISMAVRQHPRHAFSDTPPRRATFDTVVALAVIEHMNDPIAALREWTNYVRNGGHVVITTPHKSFRLAHEAGSAVGLFSHDAAEEHETMFDRGMLMRLATDVGLEFLLYRRFLFGGNQLCVMTR
jgi:2-polyprenyl-3-methyl-5-hydroxy-6-metoxy-1,4-benzoquinol methylase